MKKKNKKEEVVSKRVSIDVGFGYTKAKAGENTVVFPSVVGILKETDLNFLNDEFGVSEDFTVKIKEKEEKDYKSYYVGKLAIYNRVQRNWNADKSIDDKVLKTLIFTALSQVYDEEEVELTVGLPISIFQEQKERVKNLLEDLEAVISVNNEKSKLIRITKVEVLAQAVGALMALSIEKADKLPNLFGVIDIGYRTIDYLVSKRTEKGTMIMGQFSGSLNEDGMNNVFKSISDRLRAAGHIIQTEDIEEAVIQGNFTLTSAKGDVNIQSMLEEECEALASRIKDKINIHWKDISEELHKIFLTGGGASHLIENLKTSYTNIELQNDAQFANANGYQIMLQLQE